MVNEAETFSQSPFASAEPKVYRFNLMYKLYHFGVGIAALVGAVVTYPFFPLSIVLALFSTFMIFRPFVMAVIVDHDSVTMKGMFSARSIQRSSITAVEFKTSGKSHSLILWGDLEQKEHLSIPDLFAFDDAWDDWWRSYRDLSDGKPLSLF